MSIYTYSFSKNLSEILDVEFIETSSLSDQELDIIPTDSVLGGTDYVSGMIWITDGKDSSYIDPKDTIPDGWWKGRTMDHMYKNNPEKWSAVCSESATKQWKNNQKRKDNASSKFKNTWKNNHAAMADKARKNGKHGMFGKLNPAVLLIEYNGVEYYGWRELQEATGLSKFLYKKYYLKGINPIPRIGKNGPVSKPITLDKVQKGGSL